MRLFLLSFLFVIVRAYACEVVDDTGHTIKLARPAQRIISLAPDLTENLFAIGAGKQIIGVVQGSDYPALAEKIPIVASFNSVNLEKVLALKPDLIVVWGEGKLNDFLKKLSIPVYVNHPQHVTDIPKILERLGCLTGHERNAHALAKKFISQSVALRKQFADRRKITVFYEVWQNPLVTIAGSSWINDAIEMCGGKNSFSQMTVAAPVVNLESVIQTNPDVIISTNGNSRWKLLWKQWSIMKAVKYNHLFTIRADRVERATPRLLDGVEEICGVLANAREKH